MTALPTARPPRRPRSCCPGTSSQVGGAPRTRSGADACGVQAGGSSGLQTHKRLELTEGSLDVLGLCPEIIDVADALSAFHPFMRPIVKGTGIKRFLRVRRVTAAKD